MAVHAHDHGHLRCGGPVDHEALGSRQDQGIAVGDGRGPDLAGIPGSGSFVQGQSSRGSGDSSGHRGQEALLLLQRASMQDCRGEVGQRGRERPGSNMAAHFLEQDGQFDPAVAKPSDRFRETQGRPVQAGQGLPKPVGRVGPLGDASGERGRCLCSSPGKAQHALGHDVALDLAGAAADRSGEREEVTVRPRHGSPVGLVGEAEGRVDGLVQGVGT